MTLGSRPRIWAGVLLAGAVFAALASGRGALAADEVKVDSETFSGLYARAIGPATMSGRIAALDAYQGQRLVIFAGAASGGVWKSRNGGITFKPVFDKHCQSIGAIAIDPTDTATVWVGTGEPWVRNSTSVGDGIYKSTDGGDNWEKLGLENSERIAQIAIDPTKPSTVYVAVLGHLWDSHADRGVYRTKDGGKTWEKVLFVNEDTGCADLVLEPGNPNTIYAAMWQFRRKPWTFTSGGPGSGLYKSTDGGQTWKQIKSGLPEGTLGRIALAVSPADPNVVYANVEAKESALYRSGDKGATWTKMNSGANITIRPFYFGRLVVDPTNANRVYRPGIQLSASEDGGATFQLIAGSVHSDFHAMWINPRDPEQTIVGTDGGVYVSEDRGNNWRFVGCLPLSQFYHVSYDMERPYNVYGGLQDNGTWMGPSHRSTGIGNRHWRVLGGGDGFWAFVDPTDPDITYIEYQGANVMRVRKSTGETKEIKPFRKKDEPEYRWNWNSPIHMSTTVPGTIYLGSQYLFRSRDRGENWERISPDLTSNDPKKLQQEASGGVTVDNSSAENHCTIFTISESPKNPEVVWAGTDDGQVQMTRDGGKSWTNVTKNVTGLPPNTWVSRIEASLTAAEVAYATFDGHSSGDMKTYVYKTSDLGKTWQSLATPELKGYAHVVKEDLVNHQVLYLGTESGLFVSVDGGKQWGQFKGNLPNVAVRDLAIHPREHDLIIATHGRGVYILDDISAFRQLTTEVMNAEVAFLESRPATMFIPTGEQRFDGDSDYDGPGVSEEASITYYQKKRHVFGDLKIEIYDPQGKLVSTFQGGKRRGLNRVGWGMRMKSPKVAPAANLVPQFFSFVGPRMPEGKYTVKLIKGKDTYTSTVTLVPDLRAGHSEADRKLQHETVVRLYGMVESLTSLTDAITAARNELKARVEKLGAKDALSKKATTLADKLEDMRKNVVATREGRITGEEKLREKLGMLYGAVNGFDGRPTGSQLAYADVLEGELKEARAQFETLAAKDLVAINGELGKRKMDPVKMPELQGVADTAGAGSR